MSDERPKDEQLWRFKENWGAQFGYISCGDEIVFGVPNQMYLTEPDLTAQRIVKNARAERIVAMLNAQSIAPLGGCGVRGPYGDICGRPHRTEDHEAWSVDRRAPSAEAPRDPQDWISCVECGHPPHSRMSDGHDYSPPRRTRTVAMMFDMIAKIVHSERDDSDARVMLRRILNEPTIASIHERLAAPAAEDVPQQERGCTCGHVCPSKFERDTEDAECVHAPTCQLSDHPDIAPSDGCGVRVADGFLCGRLHRTEDHAAWIASDERADEAKG